MAAVAREAAVAAAVVVAGGAEMYPSMSETNARENMMRFETRSGCTRASTWVAPLLAVTMSLVFATGALAAEAAQKKAGATAATTAQKTFASPEDAVAALIAAVKSHKRGATLAVLGNAGDWIGSGDAVADRAVAEHFVAAFDAKHGIVRDGDKASLTIGADDYPFAFPIVKDGERWRFDTAAGKDEMLARRIGQNELEAIRVLQAIVDAQMEYASEDRNGDGVLDYAQKFGSSPGKHDGLFWPTKAGEAPSPLGALVAHAAGQGYAKGAGGGPTPYHGYYYRMLTGQTKNAESGALDYVVRGRAIGGFAVVAYPAKYGNSGIMTFLVNHDGKIYQTDLGPTTKEKASQMRRFDPGKGWTPVTSK